MQLFYILFYFINNGNDTCNLIFTLCLLGGCVVWCGLEVDLGLVCFRAVFP
jgi:hypothetical protein